MPANGGRAKCDVMCADRFPLLTEEERLLPPQHREPEAILPSCPGGLGEMSESVRVSLCNRQRGQSKRPPCKELVLHLKLWGSWALSRVSVPSALTCPATMDRGAGALTVAPLTLHALDLLLQDMLETCCLALFCPTLPV